MKNLIKIINLGTKIENIKDCVLLAGPYENKVEQGFFKKNDFKQKF